MCVWSHTHPLLWTRGISTTHTDTFNYIAAERGVLFLPYKVLLLYGGTSPQGLPFQLTQLLEFLFGLPFLLTRNPPNFYWTHSLLTVRYIDGYSQTLPACIRFLLKVELL